MITRLAFFLTEMTKRWKPLAHCFLLVLMLACLSASAKSQQKWEQLPSTPGLPKPDHSGVVPLNGFHIWYAMKMWNGDWHFSDEQLRAIKTPTWIVDGDHDELIKRENFEHLAATIPGAVKVVLPEASHFAMLQDPAQFNDTLLRFLADP